MTGRSNATAKRRSAGVADAVAPGVLRSLLALRRFYEAGSRSRSKYPGPMKLGAMAREARRARMHPEMLRKARNFAAAYPGRKLDRLFSLCRKHSYPLGISHTIRLLSVPEGQRPGFLREAAEGHWSHTRIGAEIRKRFGNRKPAVGRRRRTPEDAREAYAQLDVFCLQWERLLRALGQAAQGEVRASTDGEPALRRDLSPGVRGRIVEADRAMRELRRLVTRNLKAGAEAL